MKRATPLLFAIAALCLVLLTALPAGAQGSPVTATVDRDQVTTDDTVLFTLSIDSSTGGVGQPTLPPLDGFRIMGTSTSTQMSVINGDSSVSTSYQYRLQPLRTGELVIPALVVTVNGQQETTRPLAITVAQGTGQPQSTAPQSPGSMPNLFNFNGDPIDLLNQLDQWLQGQGPSMLGSATIPALPGSNAQVIDPPAGLTGQDYYLEAAVDNTAPYQGQQVLYSLRLYRAVSPLGQITYNAPAFSGFWSKDLPDQVQYRTEAGGRPYSVTEVQTVLFPTIAGEVTIEPGRMQIPGDFFSASAAEIASQPVTLDVKPLPANAPASFTGAVGKFDISAETDLASAKVGETVTQRVTLVGQGNVESMDDPVWPEAAGWRVYDGQAQTETDVRDGQVAGVRRYEHVLIPTAAGNLTLPPVEFSYFDPIAGVYQTVATEAATVAVTADDSLPVAVPAAGNGKAAADRVALMPDLRPVKAAPETWAVANEPITQQPMYWLLWGVPVALVLGQRGWQAYRSGRAGSSADRQKRQARKQAEKALRAGRGANPPDARAAGKILHDYLSALLGYPTAGLTQAQLAGLLRAHGVSSSLAAQVQVVLTESENRVYAPAVAGSVGVDDLLSQVEALIQSLDVEG